VCLVVAPATGFVIGFVLAYLPVLLGQGGDSMMKWGWVTFPVAMVGGPLAAGSVCARALRGQPSRLAQVPSYVFALAYGAVSFTLFAGPIALGGEGLIELLIAHRVVVR
jgi:hypothetical protein